MNRTLSLPTLLLFAFLAITVPAQDNADQNRPGRVNLNPLTLGVELEIRLADLRGSGINVPVSIRYSSNGRSAGRSAPENAADQDSCVTNSRAQDDGKSSARWTTSLSTPYIEYIAAGNVNGSGGCSSETSPPSDGKAQAGRIAIHLPGGETHEMRLEDTYLSFFPSSPCDGDPRDACDPNDAMSSGRWNGWYHATDGSGISYLEDRANRVFSAQLPDGSRYDFAATIIGGSSGHKRRAVRYWAADGSSIAFHDAAANFPNGYWIDTIGRVVPVPLQQTAPTEPAIENLGLPGSGESNFRLHWKRLKGATPEESALSDFNAQLRLVSDEQPDDGIRPTRAQGESLSDPKSGSPLISGSELFNPVVLAAVELGSGQIYRFRYSVFGEIDRITMPSDGEQSPRTERAAAIPDQRRTADSIASGSLFTDIELDPAGRIQRRSEPYRDGEAKSWTTFAYDDAGRLIRMILPDGSTNAPDWGVLMGDLAGTREIFGDRDAKKLP